LIKKIYEDQETNEKLLQITATALSEKIHNVYKHANAPFDVPDIAMLTRLTSDVWSFSAAKNYRQLHDLSQAIVDDKGYIRSFNDYKSIANDICEKYNETWLKSEYNNAIAASQNAARWTEFEKDGIKYLRYQTVGDGNVRTDHQLLDGIVKEMKDPFWNTHYPPNGWGCRCEVVQTPDASKPSKNTPSISIPGLFKTNLAKTGLIFPKNHPYYDGVPRSVIRKSILYLPPKNTYMDVMLGDYQIQVHPLHNRDEIENNLRTLKSYLDSTNLKIKDIKILPDIHQKDKLIKKAYYPKNYTLRVETKNADSIITLQNGKEIVADFKHLTGAGGHISGHINEASQKAEYIIIKIGKKSKQDNSELIKLAKSRTKHKELKGICIIDYNNNKIIDTLNEMGFD